MRATACVSPLMYRGKRRMTKNGQLSLFLSLSLTLVYTFRLQCIITYHRHSTHLSPSVTWSVHPDQTRDCLYPALPIGVNLIHPVTTYTVTPLHCYTVTDILITPPGFVLKAQWPTDYIILYDYDDDEDKTPDRVDRVAQSPLYRRRRLEDKWSTSESPKVGWCCRLEDVGRSSRLERSLHSRPLVHLVTCPSFCHVHDWFTTFP